MRPPARPYRLFGGGGESQDNPTGGWRIPFFLGGKSHGAPWETGVFLAGNRMTTVAFEKGFFKSLAWLAKRFSSTEVKLTTCETTSNIFKWKLILSCPFGGRRNVQVTKFALENFTFVVNEKVCTELMETFGIDEIPWTVDENSIKKWNINDVEEEAIEAVSNYLQILFNNSTLQLPESRHSYELGESGKLKRRLHILHDSICLWRSQKHLQRTFGENVVSLQSLIHDSSVKTLANARGCEVVEM